MSISFINKMILVMGMSLSFACSAAAAGRNTSDDETGEMRSRKVPTIARVCDRLRGAHETDSRSGVSVRSGSVGAAR